MAEIENLMLEHLKRFQATLDRIERKLNEHTGRLANLEGGQSAIVQHLAHFPPRTRSSRSRSIT